MIDTVVLTLTKDMYHISEPDKFKPSAHWVENPTAKIREMQSKQNPTKKELRSGIYKPRLTIGHRINAHGSQVMLKIELSLPKLIFGNNFDELQYKDFKNIITKFVDVLKDMGVIVSAQTLTNAPISVIHYSKNIPLTNGSTPYHYINKIKEANIKLSLDVNQTDYRNEGYSFKWHCNTYEVAFYDKIKDLETAKISSKRALEKDSELQLNIFKNFINRKNLEILRIEVRLNKRQKIKQLFKLLNIKSELTFKSLFKPATSKKILLHYVNELESKRSALIDYKAPSDEALLAALMFHNPELSLSKILQTFAFKKMLETKNIRELRIVFANYNRRGWYRLMSDTNKVGLPSTQSSLSIIRDCINKFKPLRLNKFI